jgi:hypothetical protein
MATKHRALLNNLVAPLNSENFDSSSMKELQQRLAMGNEMQEPSADESALLLLAHNEDVWLQVLMLLPPDSVANVS